MTKPTDIEAEESPEIEPETADFQDKYLRAQAELDNQRKRFETERATLLRYGQEALLEDLLPVVDNFDRATEHVPEDQQGSSWVTGIQYIQKNLMDVLAQHGISPVEAKIGDVYDPQTQEAIGTADTTEVAEDHIVQVVAKGYKLHDKLLRPVRVTVAKPTKSNEN